MDPDHRKLELTEGSRIPWDGLLLAWGAVLPLAVSAIVAWAGDGDARDAAREAARLWGAALLLFFSGVRRGLSFRTEGGPRPVQVFVFGLLFVAGLAVLRMPVSHALGLLALAFAALSFEDTRAARRGEAPLYFTRLRPWQMAVAVVAAALCWAAK